MKREVFGEPAGVLSESAMAVRKQLEGGYLLRGLRFRALNQTRSQEDAEDLVQAVVLTALEKCDELRDANYAPGWIWGIYQIHILNYFAKRRRTDQRDSALDLTHNLADSLDVEHEAIQRDLEAKSLGWIGGDLIGLLPKEREVLLRFYVNGEPKEAVREAMNLTQDQFRLLKSRSKQKLTALCRGEKWKRK